MVELRVTLSVAEEPQGFLKCSRLKPLTQDRRLARRRLLASEGSASPALTNIESTGQGATDLSEGTWIGFIDLVVT